VVLGLDEGVSTEALGGVYEDDGKKTLNDARFIVGDYVSCAVLPPSDLTGEVVPATEAIRSHVGRGDGFGREGRSTIGVIPPPSRQDRWFGGDPGSSGRRTSDYRGGRDFPRQGERDQRGGGSLPEGEWRRGERLPEPPRRSRRGAR